MHSLFAHWLVVLSSLVSLANACGMSTHIEVTHRAQYLFRPRARGDYYPQLLSENPEYLQAGAFFPDWGFSCANQPDAAEDAHWPPFFRAAVLHFRDRYGGEPPWDKKARGFIAFLFGLVSHGIADIPWHSLDLEEGFVHALMWSNLRGQYGDAHSAADTGGEFVLSFTQNLDYFTTQWKVPTNDLVSIYQRLNYTIAAADINNCMKLGYIGAHANRLAGRHAYLPIIAEAPFLAEEYYRYFRGGVDDMASWVHVCWHQLVNWLEVGPTPKFCLNIDLHDDPLPKVNTSDVPVPRRKCRRRMDSIPLPDADTGKVDSIFEDGHLTLRIGKASYFHSKPGSARLTNPVEWRRSEEIFTQTNPNPASNLKYVSDLWNSFTEFVFQLSLILFHTFIGSWLPSCTKVDSSSATTSILFTNVSYSGLGASLASGDFDGDGLLDYAIGAPTYTVPDCDIPHTGAVFIINSSSVHNIQFTSLPIESVAAFTLSPHSLNHQRSRLGKGSYIPNVKQGGRFGTSVAAVDLNCDGIDDLVVSAPLHNATAMSYDGRVFVYFGRRAGPLNAIPDLTIVPTPRNRNGRRKQYSMLGEVLFSSDLDGDGCADLLVGSPSGWSQRNVSQGGRVDAFLSSRRHSGQVSRESADFTLSPLGNLTYEHFGASMALIHPADNTDALLAVGAPGYRPSLKHASVGRMYLFRIGRHTSVPGHVQPKLIRTIVGNSEFQQFGRNIFVDQLSLAKPRIIVTAHTENNPKSPPTYMDLVRWLVPSFSSGHNAGAVYSLDLTRTNTSEKFTNLSLEDLRANLFKIKGRTSDGRFGATLTVPNVGGKLWISEPGWKQGSGRIHQIGEAFGKVERCFQSSNERAQIGSSLLGGDSDFLIAGGRDCGIGGRDSGCVFIIRHGM
ncbi:hypothetical protein BJ742DRAFT_829584 [Cladochytrium replicatum]|nr:hypothetical protein BJ742DRAFT_829584 [Cladochytrium replicatum]